MSDTATSEFDDVQRIVLRGGAAPGSGWRASAHLLIDFGKHSPLHFISRLLAGQPDAGLPPVSADGARTPKVQVSLGFTRRGLERAYVPDHLLTLLAYKAPAFHAGAARRAARHLALTGPSAAEQWDWGSVAHNNESAVFRFDAFDAMLSLHGLSDAELAAPLGAVRELATQSQMLLVELPHGGALPAPAEFADASSAPRTGPGQWVHFGYLDGLSKTGIKRVTSARTLARLKPQSCHEAGEFLLGHVQDSGGNPWVAGPGLRVWPEDARAFFYNGSFGVLQLIEQDVKAFQSYVSAAAARSGMSTVEVKGTLCGRLPDGRPLADPKAGSGDFDYSADPAGLKCPFGSHVRRMNPRLPVNADGKVLLDEAAAVEQPAHFSRRRSLLRRGMPYGPAWTGESEASPTSRGLIGHFFCASIEEQFEHLLGEWADRVAIGSPDRGGARDPFIGAHERGDGRFDLPQPVDQRAKSLPSMTPFTRTRGCAYLFYPSLGTLSGIALSALWAKDLYEGDDA
jgi:deferrochelatase/peroxidase EfeB